MRATHFLTEADISTNIMKDPKLAKMLAIATGNYDEKKTYTATNTGKWIKTKKILEKAKNYINKIKKKND